MFEIILWVFAVIGFLFVICLMCLIPSFVRYLRDTPEEEVNNTKEEEENYFIDEESDIRLFGGCGGLTHDGR
jgi:Na+-driven multidrug efflux pump